MTKRFALAALAAWMVLAALIVGRFANEAMPPGYLLRPLAIAGGAAIVLGALSLLAQSWAVPAAAGMALVLGLADPLIALAVVVIVIALELLKRRGNLPGGADGAVLVISGIFLGLGLVRALAIMDFPGNDGYQSDASGPRMVVILLDGYPRLDTLQQMGVDNQPFVDALEARGFDHYPDSHSEHTSTHRTLQAALTDQVVSDDPVPIAELRVIRRQLVVPPGFVEVDPPVGFITMEAGPHIPTAGPTDLETRLVAESALGVLAPDLAWNVLIGSLRASVDAELATVATTDYRRIFAHVMDPHPPFLYPWGDPPTIPRWCWPRCGIYAHTFAELGTTHEAWAEGMAAQIEGLNARLLTTIDQVLERDPDAVIVLFSDHGGRADTADTAELHRSFLAARTPGHPGLYGDAPLAANVIRVLLAAYGSN